jgi:hypothetical protein
MVSLQSDFVLTIQMYESPEGLTSLTNFIITIIVFNSLKILAIADSNFINSPYKCNAFLRYKFFGNDFLFYDSNDFYEIKFIQSFSPI